MVVDWDPLRTPAMYEAVVPLLWRFPGVVRLYMQISASVSMHVGKWVPGRGELPTYMVCSLGV